MKEHDATSREADDLITALEDGTLDASQFRHRDHVKVAWLYLRALPLPTALERFTAALKRFAALNGAAERYNATITWAYLLLIHERMALPGGRTSWEAFAARNDDLLSPQKTFLARYYREETLSSARARSTFLFPDRVETAL